MKCPICGNEEFIKVQSPLWGTVEVVGKDTSTYYGCSCCNLILQFNKDLVKTSSKSKIKGKEVI